MDVDSTAGPLIVSYESGNGTVDVPIGLITSATSTISKNVSARPIPSKKSSSTFPLENGNSLSYSFTFTRNQPIYFDDTSEDMTKWSNAKWYVRALVPLIDRWQMKTDGCLFTYNSRVIPNDVRGALPINPNTISVYKKRGYITEINVKYTSSFNTILSGSISFIVGRMHISSYGTKMSRVNPAYVHALMKPGDLGTYSLRELSSNGNDTVEVTFGINTNNIIVNERTIIGLRFEPDDDHTCRYIGITIPYPPSHWVSMALLSGKKFSHWEGAIPGYKDGARLTLISEDKIDVDHPGEYQGITVELTAIWRDL